MPTKDILRKLYLQKRQLLSASEYTDANHQLCKIFFNSIDLSGVKVLHTFLPIKKKMEPDTWLIIDRIRREFTAIKLAVPKVNDATGLLENFYLERLDQLSENSWGIPEPTAGKRVAPEEIDMVLVPLLAFDKAGHRVGYGKGYYDKLLLEVSADCIKIGLSLFPPVDEISPVFPMDQKMNIVIDPEMVHEFRN